MPNGYDPQKGQILVPFDLKRDVVEPLEILKEGFTNLNKRFEDHLNQVEVSVKTRMEPLAKFLENEIEQHDLRMKRKAQTKKIMWWTIGIGGPILLAAIARMMGLPL